MRTLLAVAVAILSAAPAAAVKTGVAAPTFSLEDVEGKTHSLKDYKGKHVVLEWFNPECPFVRKHYDSKNMQTLQKDFTKKGVVWLAIDSSKEGKQGYLTPEDGKEAIKKEGASPTALLLDPNGKVGRLYGAKTTPHMFVINPKGKLVYMGAIDDRPTSKAADVDGAQNYLKDALNSSMAGKAVEKDNTKPYGCSVKY